MKHSKGAAVGLLAAGAVAGGIVAATLPASAADTSVTTPSTVAYAAAPAAVPPAAVPPAAVPPAASHADGTGPANETALTGTTAAKVRAAALKAVPGGTIVRMETDANGAAYEAHMTRANGSPVTVKLDKNFTVTSVQAGNCPRGGSSSSGSSSSSSSTQNSSSSA